MHRAAIESIFGLRQGAQELHFAPCLPSHWDRAELTLRRDSRAMRFIFIRAAPSAALAAAQPLEASLLRPGQALQWQKLAPQTCFVVPLLEERVVAAAATALAETPA
jgi:cyclic beta-1,2-glucan synthetase